MIVSQSIKNSQLQIIADTIAGKSVSLLDSGGAVLGTSNMPTPAGTVESGLLTLAPLDEIMLLASGDLSALVISDDSDLVRLSIGTQNSSADLKFPFDSLSVYAGAIIKLSAWSISL